MQLLAACHCQLTLRDASTRGDAKNWIGMRYQLVVQFDAVSLGDFDDLTCFEEALRNGIGDSATVDGHDSGSGEFNIFILTNHPESTCQLIQQISASIHPKQRMAIAFRELTGGEFSILWPSSQKEFSIS
jgi:hypothetical protein